MAETSDTLHADLVFCPTTGHGVPVRLVDWPAGDEARLVCHGFTVGVCRGRCALTGVPASVMEARALEDEADCDAFDPDGMLAPPP